MTTISQEGNNRIIRGSVEGSIFPRTEQETVFSIIVDGSDGPEGVRVNGSVYGREIKIVGAAKIDGPIVSRGDVSLKAKAKTIYLFGGVTTGGNITTVSEGEVGAATMTQRMEAAQLVVRGDITASKNIYLADAVVFGSIRASNCKLERCVVLGTINVQEKLTISASAVAGYACHDVLFEGRCTMIHALGESIRRPIFAPSESKEGIINSTITYYPAIRDRVGFLPSAEDIKDLSYADLVPESDWVPVKASKSDDFDQPNGTGTQWILSLGGRVADFSKIRDSIESLSGMLKCGFEFEHYHREQKVELLTKTARSLNADENWILREICKLD